MTQIHRYGPLTPGTLVKRYKRFLVDVRLADGRVITAFTPNSGSMRTCSEPGSDVMVLHDPKPGRKTLYNLEMVRAGNTWVGVNTGLANSLGARVIDAGLTGHGMLRGFAVEGRESVWEDSRFDLKIRRGGDIGYVEIKNVTYRSGDTALFPDAVTVRGKKHLNTLIRASREGFTACNLYVVQRSDCLDFAPASEIDPDYADAFRRAREEEVLLIACLLDVEPDGIRFERVLPFRENKL